MDNIIISFTYCLIFIYYEEKNELIELDKECFGENCWNNELWSEILEDLEHNIIYLVKQSNEIIAYLMVFNWGQEKNYVKVTSIGTKSCFRGQGLAHKLIQTMIDDMKREGMRDFRGETRVTNYTMQKVFSDFNFRCVEIFKEYYDNPMEDALRYHLNI